MTSVVAVLGQGIVAEDQPIVTAFDYGFTRGDGCFDATRVVVSQDGRQSVDHLDAHLERFERSASGLDLHFDRPAWEDLIELALSAWHRPGEATLKLVLTRGQEYSAVGVPTGVATITPIVHSQLQQRTGVRLALLNRGLSADAFTAASWLLGGIKTLSYAVNMAAKREATARGADDALFISADGYALEGPNAALVWAKEDTLYSTPHENTGVLRSITQAVAFQQADAEGIPAHYRLAPIEEILAADGAWLLSSIRGVAPIVALDKASLTPDSQWTRRLNAWTGFSVS